MKKLLVLTFLASAMFIGLLPSGPEADAAGCIRCLFGGTTATVWGFGSTCQAATNDAVNQASSLIPGWCDTCLETPIGVLPCDENCSNPQTCFDPYGKWRVDLKIRFRCNENICL